MAFYLEVWAKIQKKWGSSAWGGEGLLLQGRLCWEGPWAAWGTCWSLGVLRGRGVSAITVPSGVDGDGVDDRVCVSCQAGPPCVKSHRCSLWWA